MKDFEFEPDDITAMRGRTVEVTVTNEGERAHNFSVPGLDVSTTDIPPGGTETIEFLIDKGNRFTFLSTVEGDEDAGMTGILRVARNTR